MSLTPRPLKNPRVLLVSYHFPPSNQVGARRPGRLARLLPGHGYDVEVVCASLERAVGASDESQQDLVPTNAWIHRVDTPFVLDRHPYEPPWEGTVGEMVWWRCRAYVEWVFMTRDWAWNWGVQALREVEWALAAGRYDVVVVDAPPNPAVVPVLRRAKELGIPTVCDFRDIWAAPGARVPAWARVLPLPRRAAWNAGLREEALQLADIQIFTSDEMVALALRQAPGVDPAKLRTIPNAFESVDPDPPATWVDSVRSPDVPVRILYTGSVAAGRERMVVDLLRGMAELRRQNGPQVELEVVANETEGLDRAVEREGLTDRVRVLGWIERDLVMEKQREASVLLLLQQDTPAGIRYATPAKLFEYMERRRHILGMVPADGPAADALQRYGLGRVVTSGDPGDIADALRRVVGDVRARPFLPEPPEVFSEAHTVAQFVDILDEALIQRR